MNCIDLCGGIFQRRQGFSSQNASKDQTFDDVHKCMECTLWMKCSHCVWKPLSIGHADRHLRNFHHLYVTKFGRILKVLKFSWTHGALKKCFASLQISFQNVEARYVEKSLFFQKNLFRCLLYFWLELGPVCVFLKNIRRWQSALGAAQSQSKTTGSLKPLVGRTGQANCRPLSDATAGRIRTRFWL